MRHGIGVWATLAFLLTITGPPIQAQEVEDWTGPVSLAVVVTDENGQALPGAVVMLRYSGGSAQSGPPLQETDAEGRAVFEALAAGEWQADVRREGFMLYTAYLNLVGGELPEVGFKTRQRTGSFWAPIEVRFTDPRVRISVATGKPITEKELRKEAKQQEKLDERERRQAERDDVARVVEPPPPPPPPPVVRDEAVEAEAQRREARRLEKEAERERRRAARPDTARIAESSPPPAATPEAAEPTAAVDEPVQTAAVVAPEPAAPATATATPLPDRAPPPAPPSVEDPVTEEPPAVEPVDQEVSQIEERQDRPAAPAAPAEVTAPPESTPAPEADVPPVEPVERPAPAPPEPPTRESAADLPVAERAAERPAPEPVVPPSEPEVPVREERTIEAVAEPAPPPAAAPTVAEPPRLPPILPNPNLLRSGACPECPPGEWSLAAEGQSARQTSLPCPTDVEERLEEASRLVAESLPSELTVYAGALVDATGDNDVLRLLPESARRRAAELLAPVVDPRASCQVVGVVLPRGARYVGFRYQANDDRSDGECAPGRDCQIGDARWRGNPVIERSPTVTVVYGVFENRSSERDRRPRFIAYFRPAAGWLPPSR